MENPVNHFATLAPELLEQIFIRSETLSMPLVNSHFYASLRSETVLLSFCTHVFYHGERNHILSTPNYDQHNGIRFMGQSRMGELQNTILDQEWFTISFAKKLEMEVLRLQKGYPKPHIFDLTRVQPEWRTMWPQRLLRGPWTDGKLDLIDWIAKSGFFPRWEKIDLDSANQMIKKGMREAILENKPRAIQFLDPHGSFPFTHDLLKLAVFSSCNISIVETTYSSLARAQQGTVAVATIFDAEMCNWAKDRMAKGHERGQVLRDFITSKWASFTRTEAGARWAFEAMTSGWDSLGRKFLKNGTPPFGLFNATAG
jgi:hypothetical protein